MSFAFMLLGANYDDLEGVGIESRMEEKALPIGAVHHLQSLAFEIGRNAFSDNVDAAFAAEFDDRLYYEIFCGVAVKPADDRSVRSSATSAQSSRQVYYDRRPRAVRWIQYRPSSRRRICFLRRGFRVGM